MGKDPNERDLAFSEGQILRATVKQPARLKDRNRLEKQISKRGPVEKQIQIIYETGPIEEAK